MLSLPALRAWQMLYARRRCNGDTYRLLELLSDAFTHGDDTLHDEVCADADFKILCA